MLLLTPLAAYTIGSIPTGLILTRAAGLGDIRNIGSGNIGATNVLRTGNKKLAAATLLLDMLKGFAAVKLGYWLGAFGGWAIVMSLAAALFVVVGHVFPVWLKFKGGKGVATALGATFALSPLLGMAAVTVWIAVFATSRISSLSALVALAATPPLALILADAGPAVAIITLLIALLVAWRHTDNIRRLRDGTEPRFGGNR